MKYVRHDRDEQRVLIHRILLFLFIAVLVMSVFFDSFLDPQPLREDSMVPLAEGWDLYSKGELVETGITLPYRIHGDMHGKSYILTRTLPDTYPNSNASFAIETSLRSLEVLLDGESIYTYGTGKSIWKDPVLGGSFMHYVRLPDGSEGHEISLVMGFHSYNQFSGNLQVPTLGTKSDQVLYQLRELPNLIFGIVFLFTGFIALVTSLALPRGRRRNSLGYFGWIEIALGAWVFTQNCSKFILLYNAVQALNFSYMALYLLPFFLIMYVKNSYSILERIITPFVFAAEVIVGAYILVGIAQFFGLIQYSETLQYAGLALLLFILALFIVLLMEFRQGNRDILTFLIAVGVLLLTVLVELVLLLMSVILENALFVHAGMGLSGAILLIHSVRFIAREFKSEVQSEVLLNLTKTDALTGAGNRASYEARVQQIMSNTSVFSPTGILMIDINGLKAINDTYGREKGDRVLQDIVLKMTEIIPGRSEVFRVGGDEFIVFIDSITYEQMSLICTDIQTTEYTTDACSYRVACGYSFYVKESHKSFEAAALDADAAMYDCKAGMKRQAAKDKKEKKG